MPLLQVQNTNAAKIRKTRITSVRESIKMPTTNAPDNAKAKQPVNINAVARKMQIINAPDNASITKKTLRQRKFQKK